MYSKTRNTLTALSVASLFVVAGWMFGHPLKVASPAPVQTLQLSISGSGTHVAHALSALRDSHPARVSLAVPYFSFALALQQRRTD